MAEYAIATRDVYVAGSLCSDILNSTEGTVKRMEAHGITTKPADISAIVEGTIVKITIGENKEAFSRVIELILKTEKYASLVEVQGQ